LLVVGRSFSSGTCYAGSCRLPVHVQFWIQFGAPARRHREISDFYRFGNYVYVYISRDRYMYVCTRVSMFITPNRLGFGLLFRIRFGERDNTLYHFKNIHNKLQIYYN